MRRTLFWTATGVSAIAFVVAVVVLAARSDDASGPSTATTTSGATDVEGPADPDVTTTTAADAPVGSTGAAPVDGAILAEPVGGEGEVEAVDVGQETDCAGLEAGFEPLACTRTQGSGGHFLVFVGRDDEGALRSSLHRAPEAESTEFTPVARSPVFEADVEVFGITLAELEVGGEPVVVVDYDFDGSGSVHSFDVVAWDEADAAPRVVAFVGGTGSDRFHPEGETLEFVGANYDDGAPTCCPNFADVRTLAHPAPGEWELTEETVPFSEAP